MGLLYAIFLWTFLLALNETFFKECSLDLLNMSVKMRGLPPVAVPPKFSFLPSLFEFCTHIRFHYVLWWQLSRLIIKKLHIGAKGTFQVKVQALNLLQGSPWDFHKVELENIHVHFKYAQWLGFFILYNIRRISTINIYAKWSLNIFLEMVHYHQTLCLVSTTYPTHPTIVFVFGVFDELDPAEFELNGTLAASLHFGGGQSNGGGPAPVVS